MSALPLIPIVSPVMVTLLPSTNAASVATLVVPVVSPNAWLFVTFRMPELTMTLPEKVLAPDNTNVPAGIGVAGGAGWGEDTVSEPLAMTSLMVSTAPLATVIVLGPPKFSVPLPVGSPMFHPLELKVMLWTLIVPFTSSVCAVPVKMALLLPSFSQVFAPASQFFVVVSHTLFGFVWSNVWSAQTFPALTIPTARRNQTMDREQMRRLERSMK